MAQSRALTLAANASVAANQVQGTWNGGRAALIIFATTYPTNCFLQVLGTDGTTWVSLNSTTFSANQCTIFDTPAGQYRLAMGGGTVAGLYATLVSCPYE